MRNRVKSLSSLLEHQVDHDEKNAAVLPSDEEYNTLQQQIKQELLACKACWEEGIIRLEKLEKRTEKYSGIHIYTRKHLKTRSYVECKY